MPSPLGKPTRYTILAVIILGLLYALLFYTPPHGGLWLNVFSDSLHVPVFGLIAVSLYLLWRPERPSSSRAIVALVATCVLGLLSELAQIATSRDASLADLVADCLGAAGFLGITLALDRSARLSRYGRAIVACLAVAILAWAVAPFAAVSAAYIERNARFPVIFDAESSFGRRLIRLQNARYELAGTSSTRAPHAAITFVDAPWPGIAFHDLRPDWRSYTRLIVDLEVAGQAPLALGLRVHDDAHRHSKKFSDRFNRTFDLAPGRHTLSIPLEDLRDAPAGRKMDLGSVSELIIFGTQAEAGRMFRLYGIRLE